MNQNSRNKIPWVPIIAVLTVCAMLFTLKSNSSATTAVQNLVSDYGMLPFAMITVIVLAFLLFAAKRKGTGGQSSLKPKTGIAVIVFIVFMYWLLNFS